MKTVNITSKTTMNVPSNFTMKELFEANKASFPEGTTLEKAYPTLNARVKSLIKKGELVIATSVKTVEGRGRVAIVYALPTASLNPKDKNSPISVAKKQGREVKVEKVDGVLVPIVAVTTGETVTETPAVDADASTDVTPEAVVDTSATVDVSVEVVPEPSADPVETVETVATAS